MQVNNASSQTNGDSVEHTLISDRDYLLGRVRKQKAFLLSLDEVDLDAMWASLEALDSLTVEQLREEEAHWAQEYERRGI